MPQVYKILGQLNPAANSSGALYTVPASNSAIVSTITIANISNNANTNYSINLRQNGASNANSQYIAYQAPIPNNDTVALTLGITLGAGDVIQVNANTSLVTFTAFGSEIY
jgi:hypothetical protein